MLRLSAKSPPALENLLHSPVERAAAEVSYWALDRYYALDCGAVERLLIPAVRDLWTTCLDFVARVVGDDEILSSLGIPEHAWTSIGDSWARGDPAPLARFDLSFDGRTPPKLHECNIDVAGLLYEATFFQRAWTDHQRNCEPSFSGCGQFTEIEEALASTLAFGWTTNTMSALYTREANRQRQALQAAYRLMEELERTETENVLSLPNTAG